MMDKKDSESTISELTRDLVKIAASVHELRSSAGIGADAQWNRGVLMLFASIIFVAGGAYWLITSVNKYEVALRQAPRKFQQEIEDLRGELRAAKKEFRAETRSAALFFAFNLKVGGQFVADRRNTEVLEKLVAAGLLESERVDERPWVFAVHHQGNQPKDKRIEKNLNGFSEGEKRKYLRIKDSARHWTGAGEDPLVFISVSSGGQGEAFQLSIEETRLNGREIVAVGGLFDGNAHYPRNRPPSVLIKDGGRRLVFDLPLTHPFSGWPFGDVKHRLSLVQLRPVIYFVK